MLMVYFINTTGRLYFHINQIADLDKIGSTNVQRITNVRLEGKCIVRQRK